MTQKKTMLQQVAALFRGNLIHALSQWLAIVMVSKFGGAELAGNYVLALATTAPIFMFFDFNLRVVRSTDHQHNENFANYIGLRLYTILFAVLVSLAVCLLFYQSKIWIVLAIVAYRIGESLSNLAYGGLQRAHRSDLIGRSLTGQGGLSLAMIGLVVPLTHGNDVATACTMAFVSICWALFHDYPLAWKFDDPNVPLTPSVIFAGLKDFRACKRICSRAFPLGFDAGISSLGMNAPKYCIEYFLGTESLGVFGLLSQLAYSLQKLIGAMGHAGVGLLSKHYSSGNRKQFWNLLNKMLLSSVSVGMVAVIGGTLVCPWLMRSLLGPEYGDPWLMFGLLLASSLTGAQRIAGRATQACGAYLAYTVFDVIIFLTATAASIVLVQTGGVVGGAMALAISFAVGLAATLIHVYYFLWPEPNVKHQIKSR